MEDRVSVRSLRDSFVRTFGSIPFGVSLLAVWAVLTLIGVIVDQGKESAAYFAMFPAPLARAILRLSFDNVYHSWWYVGAIALVLISMTTATFTRVIPRRLPPLRPVAIEAIPLNARIAVTMAPDAARTFVEQFFAKRGWKIRKRAFDGTEWTFADRFDWARAGVLVNHLAIVIIAAGTTLYWWKGFSGDAVVLTGGSTEIPQTHAILHLDDFRYKIAPIITKSGMVYQPIDYVSKLTVTGNDGVARAMTLRVNHPIDVDGTLYYQSSYGFGMRFDVLHNGKRVAGFLNQVLGEGDTLSIPNTNLSVRYERFVPTVDKASGQPAPDPRVNDPAVVLSAFNSGAPLGSVLVPLHTWIDLGGGWRVVPSRYVLFSGIQYRYDPGIPLVAAGAFTLLAGLVITFYFLPARLHVRVDPAGAGSTVGVAATTIKGYSIFETQFGELVAEFEKHVTRGG